MNNQLYDHIGIGYDTTRKADPEITRRLINHLQIFDSRAVIDIACGSGNYTLALHKQGINISGVDISRQMIESARSKIDGIEWFESDVKKMPFKEHEFSGAICVLAIHHFDNLLSSFKEIYRVLKPGSRFIIFTSTPEQMKKYWLNAYFPEMMEKSISQMPSIKQVERALSESGFSLIGYETFMIEPSLQDFFLYSGKYKPEIYLKTEVRTGISSFANLATESEVNSGTRCLEQDIRSGAFKQKVREYVSELGDYLYVVAEKPETFV